MYLNLPKPRDGWKADLRRGRIDVGKYKIRTRRKPSYDLFLYERERDGTWLLCLTHDMPAGIWLVGWITADEFWQTAQRHQYHGQPFWTVGKDRLHSLSPLNGYGPHAAAWLVDPQTPFWCEVCKGMHPIIEHQRCREAS